MPCSTPAGPSCPVSCSPWSTARATATRSVAVFADPVFDPTDPRVRVAPGARGPRGVPGLRDDALTRLPFSRQEAEAILAAAPPHTAFPALGFDANRSAATGAALADYRIVHFATHGTLAGEIESTSEPGLS